jgi:uncharacterized protein with GYD domain
MATYIILGTFTTEGGEALRTHPEWIKESNRAMEALGVKITGQFAVLGSYDLVTIIDASDNHTAIRASTELTLHGLLKLITLPAIPVDDFLASLQ